MLAAIILEVMEKAESDALKVMIFMIEGILPENYFSSNLRGLSVDMVVFRDLMKLRLPKLSKHLDDLQNDANDGCSRKHYRKHLVIKGGVFSKVKIQIQTGRTKCSNNNVQIFAPDIFSAVKKVLVSFEIVFVCS